ncbi:hypothetical protein GCM10008934_41090 [Virgibacillus salarius]|uniref:stage VI sporulation protein D n=1 Tax=Virgibacillus salarius TaxID=447199 RepID=UPI0004101FC3|nr:stage VI sporulation protein D [Priestia megaterium]
MSKDRPVFSFELNETLYFEKGQEVNEMRGVSLEPDISIHSFNEYISIRGVIELKGDYQKTIQEAEESIETENLQSKRYVEVVEDLDEDIAAFSHRFPVEISVPANRVADLNDVSVFIQTFDYELPNPSLFRLYSTIEIHGVNESEQVEETVTERDAYTSDWGNDAENNEEADSFQFEIKDPEENESINDHLAPPDLPILSAEREESEQVVEDREEESQEVEIEASIEQKTNDTEKAGQEEDDRWKYKESKSLAEFFGTDSPEESSSHDEEVEVDDTSDDWLESSHTPEIHESSDNRDTTDQVQDVGYLSDMFRESDVDQFARMRLCIVQEKDTIDSIAERYQISALQLIKQNQLDDDYDVTEGQLLYIPYKKK